MKTEIHPQYQQVNVHCACGESWETGSTKKELRIEICSKCHPFFTGKQKLVDSAGRIDRFTQRYAKKGLTPGAKPAAAAGAAAQAAAKPAAAKPGAAKAGAK